MAKRKIATKNIEILKYSKHLACAVTVDSSKVTADENGDKIMKAGTIIGGVNGGRIADGESKVEDKNTATKGKDAEGVLLYDVDVTNGDAEGAMVYWGDVDLLKIPQAPDSTVDIPGVRFWG